LAILDKIQRNNSLKSDKIQSNNPDRCPSGKFVVTLFSLKLGFYAMKIDGSSETTITA
jgi:hypothetical protein